MRKIRRCGLAGVGMTSLEVCHWGRVLRLGSLELCCVMNNVVSNIHGQVFMWICVFSFLEVLLVVEFSGVI